jgi:hypothetical protein
MHWLSSLALLATLGDAGHYARMVDEILKVWETTQEAFELWRRKQ